jgi:hypothetical protein
MDLPLLMELMDEFVFLVRGRCENGLANSGGALVFGCDARVNHRFGAQVHRE